jgi:TonB family protein
LLEFLRSEPSVKKAGLTVLAVVLTATGALRRSAYAQSLPSQVPESTQASANAQDQHAVLKKLSPPVYPQMARIAGISGDVVLSASVRPDGTIDAIASVSGHPVLVQAALDSAKQSEFECQDCSGSTGSLSLTYSFVPSMEKPDPCCCSQGTNYKPPATQVLESEGHITVRAAPLCICPDDCTRAWAEARSKFHSGKCLYLWKCGRRRVYIY